METIALWYEKSGKEDPQVKLDLHINFWKLINSKTKTHEYLLDLGFMVYDIRQVKSLNLHFPFDVENENFEDIGAKLQNHRLVSSVFNEDYTIRGGNTAKPKHFNVFDSKEKKQFTIYELDFGENAEDCSIFKNYYDGTKLSINIDTIDSSQDDCYKYYFRIRLKGKCFESIFTRQLVPNNKFFNSAFTATEIIDFRINEKRNYDRSLLEDINKNQEFRIKKIHFLLMRNSRDDFESNHLKVSCRLIEKDLWDKYVEKDHILDDIIAYHWSKKKPDSGEVINSFNALAKIKYHKSNWKTIIKYVVAVGALSIFFNLLTSGICTFSGWCKEKYSSPKNMVSQIEKEHPINSNKENATQIAKKVLPSGLKETK